MTPPVFTETIQIAIVVRDLDAAMRTYVHDYGIGPWEIYGFDPENVAVLNELAWLLSTCPDAKVRDGEKAVELATKVCELTKWKSIWYFDTLAAAYAETGNFEKAVDYQKRALKDSILAKDKEALARLRLYEQEKPFRDSPKPTVRD